MSNSINFNTADEKNKLTVEWLNIITDKINDSCDKLIPYVDNCIKKKNITKIKTKLFM